MQVYLSRRVSSFYSDVTHIPISTLLRCLRNGRYVLAEKTDSGPAEMIVIIWDCKIRLPIVLILIDDQKGKWKVTRLFKLLPGKKTLGRRRVPVSPYWAGHAKVMSNRSAKRRDQRPCRRA